MKLDIYVQPGAKKSNYAGLYDGKIKLKIAAIASDNAANQEVCRFIAELLNIPKSKVKIFKGNTSRLKILDIETNLDIDAIKDIIMCKI